MPQKKPAVTRFNKLLNNDAGRIAKETGPPSARSIWMVTVGILDSVIYKM